MPSTYSSSNVRRWVSGNTSRTTDQDPWGVEADILAAAKDTDSGSGGSSAGAGNSNTYNVNPQSRSGQGAYGEVPGVVYTPPNTYSQVADVYPGLNDLTQRVGNVINQQASGVMSNEARMGIQDAGAAWGVGSGMPGSGVRWNRSLRDIGRNVQDLQQKGVENYNSFLSAMAGTMTPQELAAAIATWNATNSAAPDPQDAAEQARADYMEALRFGAGSGGGGFVSRGGPAGGTSGGSYSGASSYVEPANIVANSLATGYAGGDHWVYPAEGQPYQQYGVGEYPSA